MLSKYIVLTSSLLTLLSLVSFSSEANTNAMSSKEAHFKAALIYKMGSYLSWIPPKEQVNYCFVGEATWSISKILEQKSQLGQLPKPIIVTEHDLLKSNQLTTCDIVYAVNDPQVSETELSALPNSIFTISNNSQALQKGFIASIELYNKKPLLSISKNNLKKSNVSVNSRFLSYVDLR